MESSIGAQWMNCYRMSWAVGPGPDSTLGAGSNGPGVGNAMRFLLKIDTSLHPDVTQEVA